MDSLLKIGKPAPFWKVMSFRLTDPASRSTLSMANFRPAISSSAPIGKSLSLIHPSFSFVLSSCFSVISPLETCSFFSVFFVCFSVFSSVFSFPLSVCFSENPPAFSERILSFSAGRKGIGSLIFKWSFAGFSRSLSSKTFLSNSSVKRGNSTSRRTTIFSEIKSI